MSKITPGSDLNAEFNVNDKVRFFFDNATGEYGQQIKLINKTGGATNKGYLVQPSSGTDLAFDYVAVDEAGIADGSTCWIWISGLVQIYFIGNVSREDFARNRAGIEGGSSGQAIAEAMPGSPFATDKHFQEVAHCVEARVGAGLAKCVMSHLN